VENSVGKLAAYKAPNASVGKESMANSHPPFGEKKDYHKESGRRGVKEKKENQCKEVA